MNISDERKFARRLRSATIAVFLISTAALGQAEGRIRNNPYSPSPNSKVKPANPPVTKPNPGSSDVSFVMRTADVQEINDNRAMVELRPSIAQATYKIAKDAETRALPLTEVYKIGSGDVLFISLKNYPQGSGYFTVRADGTIDYPLAGENVQVLDQTTDVVEDIVAGGIKLFPDPQVEVRVRQYGSHRISVAGLVENAGEKYLQREAMPLYAIRAEAVVSPKVSKVNVLRGPHQKSESYDPRDPKTDDVLIYPGNTVEFTAEAVSTAAVGSFFIGGDVVSGGQKNLTDGLTLYQAVIVSGGTKGDPKKAIIRRKNEKGTFTVIEHSLRSIRDGKAMDPFLSSGDVIEIKN